jgi:hypothetical protein
MIKNKCISCEIEKDIDQFKIVKKTGKLINSCKECVSIYQRNYREKNNENLKLFKKEFYTKNKESIKNKSRIYRKNNTDKLKIRDKKYNELNKEKIKIKQKGYAEKNKINIAIYKKEWGQKESSKLKKKDYYNKNKHILNKKAYARKKERLKTDNFFKFKESIRSLVYNSFYRNGYAKNSKTHKILNCNFEDLKKHIESKFESWMNWGNYGLYNGELNYGWDIDHIIPINSALTEEEVIKLNDFKNLQPLCSKVNRYIKKDIF